MVISVKATAYAWLRRPCTSERRSVRCRTKPHQLRGV